MALEAQQEMRLEHGAHWIKAWRRHPERRSKHVLVQTMERHRRRASDRSVVVWERAGDGRMEATDTLRGHKKAILCLAAAGDVVCSGSADRTVRVWRRRTENTGYTCLAVLEGHGAPVTAVRSVALVCSGALDGEVKIWSVLVPCLLER
ncbi:hypothetical protein SETIT_6G249200v2 [Setaria italica]|uniref:Uncharacterized protein n=1 Tax=Setaria italica TaxID=4555 RepID=K3YLS5_SETIT|nr:hypothetical protein SETIT_6G249200v2 [Setaria italica]